MVLVFLSVFQCTTAPMPGLLFNRTKQHIYGTSHSGNQISSNQVLRSGKSCSYSSWFLLALFYYGGGGGVEEASKNGGIQKVAIIDRESTSYAFGFFYQECTVVWGE
ncbi:MAG: hypothetical protein JJT78_06800 [Leptospira sp.]|nr:hypothetical protein [Leptospira sp.]